MSKSADAFRTISEVAEWLDTPAHVLRFWESKFTQVKPVKRAGGRRYYRPADMRLLAGLKKLLHEDGMTIKGAQKVLREQGIRYVSSLCTQSLGDTMDEDAILDDLAMDDPIDTVVPFAKLDPVDTAEPGTKADIADAPAPHDVGPVTDAAPSDDATDAVPVTGDVTPQEPLTMPDDPVGTADPQPAGFADDSSTLPAFLQHSIEDRRAEDSEDGPASGAEPPNVTPPPAEILPVAGPLTHLSRMTRLSAESARGIAPLLEQLTQRLR